MVRRPQTTYHYLRVTIDGPVKPGDVTGASSEHRQVEAPIWRDVSRDMTQKQNGRDTVLIFDVPQNVPAEPLGFAIDPPQPHFLRQVELHNTKNPDLRSCATNPIPI